MFFLISTFYLHTEHPWLQNAKKAPNVPLGDVVKSRLKQFSMMNRFKRKALRVGVDCGEFSSLNFTIMICQKYLILCFR